ncbi:MAG: TonB-dependent receptor [Crocinitomicaceae bacterium]|nr:TonB-dependent receptor [Crocinitomicaceae bacterium]
MHYIKFISISIFFFLSNCLSAQNAFFKAIVVDDFNSPIPYAHVKVIESSYKTACDENGVFSLNDIQFPLTINISAVGFNSITKLIKSNNGTLRFTLKEQNDVLDQVVISANLEEVKKKDSPISVEVYSSKFLKKIPVPSLMEASSQISGLRPQLNCAVCNTGDIHINGMEGAYSMVVMDGMPIVGGLSTIYGIQGIPISLIQRLEVVKGPASTLYGSEAMAGLINVITKKASCVPDLSMSFNLSSWNELQADVLFKSIDGKKLKAVTAIDLHHYDNPIDNNGDYFTDLTLKKRYSFYNKFEFVRKENKPFIISTRYFNENRWGGQMNWNELYRGSDSIYGESILTNRFEVSANYQLPTKEKIYFQSSASLHDQKSWYGNSEYMAQQHIGFGQFVWHKKWKSHQAVSGLALRYNFYDDNTQATQTLTLDSNVFNQPNKWLLPGLFFQDRIKIDENKMLLGGIRVDYHSNHGFIYTPRLNVKLNFDPSFIIRFGYGNGFRVVNVFTEDHAALTGARELVFLEDLNPEKSNNLNFNLVKKIQNKNFRLDLETSLFYTRFSNKIIPDYLTNDNQIIYSNLNGYGISKGASLEMRMLFKVPLKATINATILDVSNYSLVDGLQWVKEKQLFAENYSVKWSLSYTHSKSQISFDYTANLYGPMKLPILENDFRPEYSSTFSIQNFKISRNFGDKISGYIGVRNFLNFTPPNYSILRANDPFDQNINDPIDNPNGYTFDASYMYASFQGINAFIGGTISF